MTSSSAPKVIGNFGRLWGRGHESFAPSARRILSVTGASATTFLQGLVTSDLTTPPPPPQPESIDDKEPGLPSTMQRSKPEDFPEIEFSDTLRSTCFLDNKGRVVTDSLLWKQSEEQYFIDCPGETADTLWQHLKQFKLRRTKVKITDQTEQMASHVVFGTLNATGSPPGYLSAMDPRHPSLGLRILQTPDNTGADVSPLTEKHADFASKMSSTFPLSEGNYELVRRLAGVAEGKELTGRIALESNQEFLNAVSFHKGCYLGQELTARVHYTGAVRKRILPMLLMDTFTEVPNAWALASSLQEGRKLQRFTRHELKELPSRLPRISVAGAGHLVSLLTGSMQPDGPAVDEEAAAEWKAFQDKAAYLVEQIGEAAVPGAKIIDQSDGRTIGQVVSEPINGTNVITALVRLESVGLMQPGVWSKTNKIKIGDTSSAEFRYLPYLPLWWPDVDPESGKAKDPDAEEDEEDVYVEPAGFQVPREPKMEMDPWSPVQGEKFYMPPEEYEALDPPKSQ
jgi:folate-binding protein YgfZ